jgi:sporulation protein YqfC
MLEKITNYIRNDEFSISIWNNKINLLNFKKIIILTEEKIIVSFKDEIVTIKGENLSIKKLLEKEILVTGKINTIGLGEQHV